ncbi:sulfotransferase family 2 domain-containing protein [Limimaricola pyoseonensis]|uniref:Sulfotransferase family protein n=1 Tax=Limimaricola pyoseonensis TaxID=521013 RepID=A0A1G7IW93_9RHOB|nr:sulfotransferase family 2 domain-containing protein [Limimaricola pyoseonensis]SDF16957.1 Sulfotransferase family protein [Limimaricola pyoseonensis]
MPFFKAGSRLVYYAHVPKCGGMAVASYLAARFGEIAFHDRRFAALPEPSRWSRSSPQHVDAATLDRLIPLDFFDACFAIVRHPVGRAVSSFHFQKELERTIPEDMGFSDWLERLPDILARDRFAFDNHIRPMAEIVPAGATLFHIEHGLDALIPWLDGVEGAARGDRVLPPENARGAYAGASGARVRPTAEDLDRIATIYAADFDRFGYVPDAPRPLRPAPPLNPEFRAARDRDLQRLGLPWQRLRLRLRRRLRRI